MESLELDCSTENEEDMYLNSAAMLKALKMKNTVPQHNSQKDKGIIQGNEEELKLDVPIQTVNKQGSRKKGGNKSTGARLRSARRKQPNDLVESDTRKIISAQEILSFDNDILIVEQSMGDSVNNIDDNNYEMKIKILWRSKDVHRLNIRRNEGFKKIFEYFANLEQVSIDDIVITKKDKSIKHNDTPASTNLSVIDILGYGKCGVAVIRISGEKASFALEKMTNIRSLKPRIAFYKKIFDPETKEVLDKGLCLWFPEPNSYTGEDLVELHVHGGIAVVTSILNALSKLQFHVAPPGEFTRRAFLNGKLDLTEAEGIGDLIEAETEKQRKQACNQASGSLRRLYDSWRSSLLNIMALLEAYVDFSEEHSMESNVLEDARTAVQKLLMEITQHLSDGRKGEILRAGVRVTILGEPNVGKSSLLNLLSQKDAAIVTPSPGTTRDVIELTANICGYPMILADTAGIRNNPESEVEVVGIRKAKEYSKTADFVVCVINAESRIDGSLENFLENYKNFLEISKERTLMIVNKVDLLNEEEKNKWRAMDVIPVSCKTQEGLNDVVKTLGMYFEEICGDPSTENPVISHARYRSHLMHVIQSLQEYLNKTELKQYDMAISLQDIRSASIELGKITGTIGNEEVLDVIFRNFCIGK